jgi:hypothetical protein
MSYALTTLIHQYTYFTTFAISLNCTEFHQNSDDFLSKLQERFWLVGNNYGHGSNQIYSQVLVKIKTYKLITKCLPSQQGE